MEEIEINKLAIGEEAKIIGYEKGTEQYRGKLLAMGLIKGTIIKLKKVAPMGDPIEIEVKGYKLSIRKSEGKILKLRRIK